MLDIIEGLGDFPRVTRDMLIALLPKDDGGLRPIGLYRALYRLWAKSRVRHWRQWERDEDPQQFFGAGEGRSCTDIVWRMGVRAEGVDLANEEALTAMYDLAKCYEHLCHARLWTEGCATKFPLTLLRITLRSYRWGRRITLGKLLAAPAYALRGIVAGCTSATSELKAFMMRKLSAVAVQHPR
eukprot:7681296-Karenia_brevis.AAC.1